jgi:hypothetical protein
LWDARGTWYGAPMQPRDGSVSFDPSLADGGAGQEPGQPGSIRERQRRRRNAGRARTDLTAVLSRPDEEEEEEGEEEEGPPPGPPPARVYVVFRGVSWEDPQGGLRESDSIVGVYASEEAARRAVASLEREGGEAAESWYQPYAVQE